MFVIELNDLQATDKLEMRLEQNEGLKLVSISRMRRYTLEEVAIENAGVRELLVTYLIEPSTSVWSSHATFSRKKNGTLSLCCNYARLNRVTKGVEFHISDILDECEMLDGKSFCSGSDGMSGYYVVPIWKEDRELTNFVFNH